MRKYIKKLSTSFRSRNHLDIRQSDTFRISKLSISEGQTMLEALVALGAALIVVFAITIVVVTSLDNMQFSKNQTLATQYAQEGMEIVRKIKDNDWSTFFGYTPEPLPQSGVYKYCLNKGTTTLVAKNDGISGCWDGTLGESGQNVDLFAREVDIEPNSDSCPFTASDNATKVTVMVSWTDSKCTNSESLFCHTVKLVSCFSDYNVVSTP